MLVSVLTNAAGEFSSTYGCKFIALIGGDSALGVRTLRELKIGCGSLYNAQALKFAQSLISLYYSAVVGGIVSCAALFGPFGRQTMVRVKRYVQFGRYWAMVYSIEVQLVQLLLLINPRLPLPAVAETR